MLEFREKKRFRGILSSKVTIGILVVLVALLGRGVWGIYSKQLIAVENRFEAERELAALAAREQFLESEVNKLTTENGIALEIREKYNVRKPGEEVVVIVDATTTTEADRYVPGLGERVREWFSGWW